MYHTGCFNCGVLMKIVAKNPMWDRKHLFFMHISEYDTFYGELLPIPKWAEADSLCITADIPSKMRIIPKRLIVSIDDTAQKPVVAKPIKPIKTFNVKGSKGEIYTVTIDGKHSTCTCTGFGFRRTCKHIKEAS
jgi:hypothetical protein